jgi:hypothetical protein
MVVTIALQLGLLSVSIGGHDAQRCMWEIEESVELERSELSWTKECGKGD